MLDFRLIPLDHITFHNMSFSFDHFVTMPLWVLHTTNKQKKNILSYSFVLHNTIIIQLVLKPSNCCFLISLWAKIVAICEIVSKCLNRPFKYGMNRNLMLQALFMLHRKTVAHFFALLHGVGLSRSDIRCSNVG